MLTICQQLGRPLADLRRCSARSCSWMTSRNCASMLITGLSEFMLLWKTVEISLQRSAAQLLLRHGRDVLAVEADAAAGDAAGRVEQAA